MDCNVRIFVDNELGIHLGNSEMKTKNQWMKVENNDLAMTVWELLQNNNIEIIWVPSHFNKKVEKYKRMGYKGKLDKLKEWYKKWGSKYIKGNDLVDKLANLACSLPELNEMIMDWQPFIIRKGAQKVEGRVLQQAKYILNEIKKEGMRNRKLKFCEWWNNTSVDCSITNKIGRYGGRRRDVAVNVQMKVLTNTLATRELIWHKKKNGKDFKNCERYNEPWCLTCLQENKQVRESSRHVLVDCPVLKESKIELWSDILALLNKRIDELDGVNNKKLKRGLPNDGTQCLIPCWIMENKKVNAEMLSNKNRLIWEEIEKGDKFAGVIGLPPRGLVRLLRATGAQPRVCSKLVIELIQLTLDRLPRMWKQSRKVFHTLAELFENANTPIRKRSGLKESELRAEDNDEDMRKKIKVEAWMMKRGVMDQSTDLLRGRAVKKKISSNNVCLQICNGISESSDEKPP